MSDKHTPGPWRIATKGNIGNTIEAQSGRKVHDLDDGMRTLATFQSCCASDLYVEQEANQLANGRLIAAAPDLLAQLESTLGTLSLMAFAYPPGSATRTELDREQAAIRAAIARAKGE